MRIKNIEASTLLEYNAGIRDHFEYRDAMLTKSLFYDHMVIESDDRGRTRKNHIRHNGVSTRDIIGLEFNYGCRGYDEEIVHLQSHKEKAVNGLDETSARLQSSDLTPTERYNLDRDRKRLEYKIRKFDELLGVAEQNQEKYRKLSKDEVRHLLYRDGVTIEYTRKDGSVYDKIHYVMLFRSTGKAKKGSCMFINEDLYDEAIRYLRMGIELPEQDAMIVEISAYAPLVSSTIISKIHIDPSEILIMRDVDRHMMTDIVSVELDEDGKCVAKKRSNQEIKNTLFDGQALIDNSIFPPWGNGYLLLRQHFFKAAAFRTHIQKFFRHYCKEHNIDYETYELTDMFGRKVKAKDVKLITTDNACKWLKFDIGFDYWAEWVKENGSHFGIVKTAHASKLGDMQRMSYQMVNSMSMADMEAICQESVEYVYKLRNDPETFLDYLARNRNYANDYEVLLALYDHNPEFADTDYYKDRRKEIIQAYSLKVKSGKLLQVAENLTIVGNPYAMLLYAASGDPDIVDQDDTLQQEDGAIQCYTERFVDGEYLAEFRSPFNSRNNLGCLHNVLDKRIKKYFTFGSEIVAVNLIHTDFQDRNNGLISGPSAR